MTNLTDNSREPLTRRNFLKFAGLVGTGAGIATVLSTGRGNSSPLDPADLDRFLRQTNPTDFPSLKLSEYSFETVTVDRTGQIVDRRPGTARSWREPLGNNLDLEMVYLPGGRFLRGSTPEEKGDQTGSERPRESVTIAPFALGKYPITVAQWRAIATLPKIHLDLPDDPAFFPTDNHPVERVSWYEAIEFCQRLSKATGKDYRLPSEARWEYACRAGTTTPFYCGETVTAARANYFAAYDPYADESGSAYPAKTTPVGSYAPNAFGLYDMHGNVNEWCADLWHQNYKGQPPLDGSAWLESDPRLHPRRRPARVVRGGSWGDEARHLRSANRTFCLPEKRYSVLGFRVMVALT
ncbi:formylglycine-generating enzyme family protein [Pannus brasiliensis CCIBt3594]|uniref:Formylglycine-generating enzyme family protein n=1 Tax=Pannus brasiliensis CCIBt3594 TaxID=1427578 RepID=A0AAW9QUY8_9CHRO